MPVRRSVIDPHQPGLVLYHATARRHLAAIRRDGLRGPVYLGAPAVAAYYAEVLADEDEEAVTLGVRLDALDPALCAPDQPGISEPITGAIGCSEDEVHTAWAAMPGTWTDSLTLVGSLRYAGTIPAAQLSIEGQPLREAAARRSPRRS